MKPNKFSTFARASLLALAPFCVVSTASAQSGTWIGISYGDLWSSTANWTGGTIADGAGNNANFSTLDLPEGLFAAELDSPRTLGSLTFGDTNITAGSAGSWLLENNFDALNILTLSGTPTITVNALGDIAGTPATAQISAVIAGTGGLIKAGAGPLILSGINTFTGATTVNAGTLSLNAANAYAGGTTVNGGTLNINAATAIGAGALTITGGSLGATTGTTLTTNNAQTWNSNVTYAGPLNLNLGTGAVATGGIAREVIANAGILTVGGVITSPGLTKSGAGQLTLGGNNLTTLTGGKTFKGGIVALGGGQANIQNAIGVTTGALTFEGGTLSLNGSGNADNNTVWGTLANPITVATGQTGTLNCPPRGTFSSVITGAGTLNLGLRNTRWDFGVNMAGFTGTLNVNSTINPAFADLRVNGTGQFVTTKLNLGASVYMTQLFNAANNTAGTTQSIGQLSGDVGSILAGQPILGRYVNWSIGALNTSSTFAGTIVNGVGACRIYKVGTGTLTLTGDNTYTGNATGISGTQISAGTLLIGNGGATGSLGATDTSVASGAFLTFNRDSTTVSTYPGILSGVGTVTKLGTGRVNFHGVNTYTAGTAIKGGTIGINSASSLGAIAGAVNFTIADGGILSTIAGVVDGHTYNIATGLTASFGANTVTDSLEISTSIAGAGNLGVDGLGVLTVSGANAFAGITTITSGTLVAANVSGSATSGGAVALNGGNLGGTGTLTGMVTTATGSGLKPGGVTPTSTTVGILTVGGLAIGGGTTLNAEFASTFSYDKVVVTTASALTSTATLANPVFVDLRAVNSVSKFSTPGTYDLIQFSGTFTGSANDLFEVTPASQQVGNTYTFSNTGTAIRLTITGPIPHIWNVNAPGNWTNAGNWDTGAPNSAGAIAHFASAISGPTVVTLDASQTVGTLLFNNSNPYEILPAINQTLTFDQFLSANAEISVLLGNPTIGAALSLVDPLTITLNGAADSISLTGAISGAVGISKASPGNLTLGGNNTSLSGPVAFSNGTLTFASNGLGTGNLTLGNASLVWSGHSQDITVGRTITFENNPITFVMDSDVTLANNFGLTGTANLTKDGSGTLTLLANTTFSGNLTVLNGNLTLGNGGASGSVLGAINLANASSVMTVSRSGAHTIGNLISGTGSLVLDGTGIQSLTQANTFSGTTTINAGTAKLLNGLAFQNSQVLYNVAGGAIDFDLLGAATFGSLEGDKSLALQNSSLGAVALTAGGKGISTTYTGILSGPGSLTKLGAGIMTLTGVQTYTGFTQVNGGVLELPTGASITTTTSSIGAGAGQILVNGGTLTSSALSSIAPGGPNGLRVINGGTATFSGGLVTPNADGGLIYVESGSLTTTTLSFGRTQSYTNGVDPVPAAVGNGTGLVAVGGTVLITGTMNIGTSNSSASALVDGGNVTINGTTTLGVDGGDRWSRIEVRSGTFTSTDTSPTGGVVLSTKNPDQTRSQFLVSGGTATVERIGFGDDIVNVNNIGRLTISSGSLYVGSGGLVQPAISFVTQIQLFGGTLGAKAAFPTVTLPISTANTFTIKAADATNVAHDINLAGALTGTGSLVKDGGGILTVSGAYSYTGSTKVSAGTLVLNTATLSNTSTVDVSAAATINLPHGLVDTVAGFLIDGVSQGSGTFTSLSHPGRITGSGSLFVVNPDPYTGWASGFGLAGANALPGADADSDGQSNALEFALNSNPTSGASSGKERTAISLVVGENALTYTLPVRTGAVFGGATSKTATIDLLSYTLEGSDELTAWGSMVITEVTPALSVGLPAVDVGWTYHTFRTPGDVSADATDFIRCKVVK